MGEEGKPSSTSYEGSTTFPPPDDNLVTKPSKFIDKSAPFPLIFVATNHTTVIQVLKLDETIFDGQALEPNASDWQA